MSGRGRAWLFIIVLHGAAVRRGLFASPLTANRHCSRSLFATVPICLSQALLRFQLAANHMPASVCTAHGAWPQARPQIANSARPAAEAPRPWRPSAAARRQRRSVAAAAAAAPGGGKGVQLTLPDGTSVAMPLSSVVIGSGAGADLQLSGSGVAAQHARLESKVGACIRLVHHPQPAGCLASWPPPTPTSPTLCHPAGLQGGRLFVTALTGDPDLLLAPTAVWLDGVELRPNVSLGRALADPPHARQRGLRRCALRPHSGVRWQVPRMTVPSQRSCPHPPGRCRPAPPAGQLHGCSRGPPGGGLPRHRHHLRLRGGRRQQPAAADGHAGVRDGRLAGAS